MRAVRLGQLFRRGLRRCGTALSDAGACAMFLPLLPGETPVDLFYHLSPGVYERGASPLELTEGASGPEPGESENDPR